MRVMNHERTCREAGRSDVAAIRPAAESSHPSSARASFLMSLLALTIGLSACSHMERRADGTTAITSSQEQSILKDAPATANDLNDTGSDLEGIPLEVNRMVLQWIDYFQGRGRPHMERYLSRSTRYAPVMKEILRQNGLPEDLIYIALIESGFSSTAHSSAAAVGYWQFIRGTGRHYNLQIDSYVDERRDFIRSTQAAAEYFKGLYNLFGAWYLAIASYNVGENRVKNVIMRNHTRDFWQLARENRLPDETINYVPKFLAARLIAKEPEKYGFTDIEYMPPLEFDEAEFSTAIDIKKLAEGMGLEYDDLRDLNPAYKRGVAFAKSGKLKLRIPKGMQEQALAAATAAEARNRKIYVAEDDWSYYRVRRGDTISTLARKFNTSQHYLRKLNRLSVRSMLVAGRRIRVPAETVGGLSKQEVVRSSLKRRSSRAVTAKNGRTPSNSNPKIHIVRRGDTLIDIARRYNVSIRELTRHNQLNRRAKIFVGARLEIPN